MQGDDAFEVVRRSIFRIQAEWVEDDGTKNGFAATGFTVGQFQSSGRLVLATARHVVEVPADRAVGWTIQQFGDRGAVGRKLQFSTHKELKADVPYRLHNTLDVGVFVLPSDKVDPSFSRLEDEPLPIIDPTCGASTGTVVGWAGFPGLVEEYLGFPQLCYFQGVVSAMVARSDKWTYIVDGHNASGVSGGPVWHWSRERNRVELIGIVSQYGAGEGKMPGFCVFEPINPVAIYLRDAWKEAAISQGDPLIVNCEAPATNAEQADAGTAPETAATKNEGGS